ncbi:hypothetical protein NMY22_g6773 [Coprinellus aureogranulatus]|nr:hypothetical protein NMY22_g6773 [Coprinellus aureogranulatus]
MPTSTTEPAVPQPLARIPTSTTELDAPRLFILIHGTRQVLVPKPTDYTKLQQSIHRHFPEIPIGHRVSFHTKDLPLCNGSSVEVSPEVWPTVIPTLERITVHALEVQELVRFVGTGSARCSMVTPPPVMK